MYRSIFEFRVSGYFRVCPFSEAAHFRWCPYFGGNEADSKVSLVQISKKIESLLEKRKITDFR